MLVAVLVRAIILHFKHNKIDEIHAQIILIVMMGAFLPLEKLVTGL